MRRSKVFLYPEMGAAADLFRFRDARDILLQCELLHEDADAKVLFLESSIQAAVQQDMEGPDRLRYLRYCIKVMLKVFPTAWADDAGGFIYHRWDLCRRYISHVIHLSDHPSVASLDEIMVRPLITFLL